jgi:hypothetical protein
MIEKFETALAWHEIDLKIIHALFESGEVVRAVGLARTRRDGLRDQLEEIKSVIGNSEHKDIERSSWVREEQNIETELKELELIINQLQ